MIGGGTRARPDDRRVGPLVAAAGAGIVIGIAAGWTLLVLTRPSDNELQRAVLHEVGLPAELESAPVIGRTLDTYTDRIEARVLDEVRPSATLALAVGVIAGAAGTALACGAAQRSRAPQRHGSHENRKIAHACSH